MAVWHRGGLHARAAAKGYVAFCLLCAVAGLWAPLPAHAGVQLTGFSVDSPPPPESEPAPKQPAQGALPASSDLPVNDATVGTLAGQAGTDGGAATYHVSVVVPPGRAGMQPALSLNYSSRSGNGVMGVGWSISGASSIHRCPQTPEQDNATLGVTYTNNDRLCLDGQRLVVTNGNTYGTNGTVYSTEVDSYARITQTGGGLTGAGTCFRVEHKDGRVLHYGAVTTGSPTPTACASSTANARVQPGGAVATLIWMVEKIEDRVGNNQLYKYTDYGDGEVLLYTVTYTGFGSAAGDRTVTFAYEGRTAAAAGVQDVSSNYLAGGLTMQTQALQSITTAVAGTTVRTYTPHYVVAAYSQRLLMASLQECAGGSCNPALATCPTNIAGTACHPPTRFVYNDAPLNTPKNFPLTALNLQNHGLPASTYAASPYSLSTIADLDGDGTRETAATVTENDGPHAFLVQFTGDRAVQNVVELTGTPFQTTNIGYADIDGDGRSELIEQPLSGAVDQHLAFGVRNSTAFPRGKPATSNPFITVPSNIPFAYGTDGPVYTADINGDGKVDVIVVKPDATCGANSKAVFVYINAITGALGSSAAFTIPGTHLFCLTRVTSGGLFHEPKIDHIADFNGDGSPDFYLVYVGTDTFNGALAGVTLTQPGGKSVSALTCGQSGFLTADECSGQNNYYTRWLDINGDGLEDFVIARPGGNWQVRLNQGGTLRTAIVATGSDGLDIYATGGTPTTAFKYLGKLPVLDVDGDGKPDLTVPSQTQGIHGFALKMCTIEHVTTIGGPDNPHCPIGTPSAPITPMTQTGLPAICPVYACPEDPASTVGTAKKAAVNMPLNAEPNDSTPYPYQWKDENGHPEAAFDMYDSDAVHGGTFVNDDNSVYHLSMLKFVQTDANTITVNRVETPLTSRLNTGGGNFTQPDDLFGDGLVDVISPIGCSALKQSFPSGNLNNCQVVGDGTYGPDHLLDGPDGTVGTLTTGFNVSAALYASVNQGVSALGGSPNAMKLSPAQQVPLPHGTQTTSSVPLLGKPILPGLADAVVNGVGDVTSWGYLPLSVPESDYGFPLYSIPGGTGYTDSRHYYFQSSMPVVYGMLQSPAVGSDYGGARSAVYGYSQAMYNHLGRGFQGFYQILSKVFVSPNASVPMQARAQEIITTYNQKFPLAGKVACVHTVIPGTGAFTQISCQGIATSEIGTIVRAEADNWVCDSSRGACPTGTSSPNTIYAPVLDTQTVATTDLGTGTQSGEVDTANASGTVSGWDAFGNLTAQTITRSDKGSSAQLFVGSHTTTITNAYDTSDTAHWWVDKLTGSVVNASVVYDATNHPLPGGGNPPAQNITTGYTWNADRTPATKTVQAGLPNQQSTTTYCYPGSTTAGCPTSTGPSYGLPSQVQVNAPDLTAALSPTRTTKYTYTKNGLALAADGYFVLTTTNALSQVTTTTHETNDGQVINSTDPNGVQTIAMYDPFGRAIEVHHKGNDNSTIESAIQSSYTSCLDTSFPPNPGHCPATGVGEDSSETNAAYRITTVQAGYPTQVTWYDLLGRAIKQAHGSFSGTFIANLTDYDDLGTTLDQSTPYLLGDTPFFTGLTYDALNRPTKKIAPGSEMDPTHGDIQTDYTYSGRQTTLIVHATASAFKPVGGVCPTTGALNLCLKMTRSTNVLGQLMQTTESPVLAGAATTMATNYWTEPLGHVVAMTDAEGNLTTASYNPLGQRTLSSDPDQGAWVSTYDALGELLTQQDARNVVITVNSRDALGRTTEQQQVPPAGTITGLDPNLLIDDWFYDPANGIGELDNVVRYRGTSRTAPLTTNNPQVWKEQYTYEAATARPKKITTTISEGGGASFVSSMDYDASNGRPNTHTYPSGLVVKNNYTSYGQLQSLTNNGTTTYWTATAENEWGHVTAETFTGGTTGSHADYHSTGQAYQLNWTGTDKFLYGYDSFGNLVSQSRSTTAANGELYAYDPLQRLTQAKRTVGTTVNYGYNKSGNLNYKDDFSTNSGAGTPAYTYAGANSFTNNCGPHAANNVTQPGGLTTTYTCDKNGNVIGGSAIGASFDADNHPTAVTHTFVGPLVEPCKRADTIFCDGFQVLNHSTSSGQTTWAYDSAGQRDYEVASAGARYYGPAGYEKFGSKLIHELGPVIVTRVSGVDSITVVLKDRLGSTLDVIDAGAPTQRAYDAFGKARNGDMSDRLNGTLNLTDTIHGFTEHTHADDVALIHMNGRVFDYNLGRFLSVDPIVSHPLSSQGLNPYSYIMNNPLSGTDPTGYADCVVSQDNSCTASAHDSRSADPFSGRVTFSMGSDTNVRAYSSEGGSAMVINNSGGGNGAVSMGTQGAGGIKNAQAAHRIKWRRATHQTPSRASNLRQRRRTKTQQRSARSTLPRARRQPQRLPMISDTS